MSDLGFGSRDRPVRLSPFRRITEVSWGHGINVLEIDYPSDSSYRIDLSHIPVIGSYGVGDIIDKTLVTGKDVTDIVFNVSFDEHNPVGPEIAGSWKTGFFFDSPRNDWVIPVIPVVDGTDPNAFHDADQHAMDIWHDWWVSQVQQMYDNNTSGYAKLISDFKAKHVKTQILTVSEFGEFLPTPKDGWGTRTHLYNNTDDLEYVSQLFSFLRGSEFLTETLDASLVYGFFGTNASTATGGFSFTMEFKAKRSTIVVAQYWEPIDMNKDVYLINSKLLKDTVVPISLLNPTEGSGDAVNATFTYKSGAIGDFVVASGRHLTVKSSKKVTAKIVGMTGETFDILARFDGNGFVDI